MLVSIDDAMQRLLKQPRAELAFCVAFVARETSDEGRANLVKTDQASTLTAWELRHLDRSCHKRHVTDDNSRVVRVIR